MFLQLMIQYKYENAEVAEPAVLWETDGMVSFQSRGGITDWHGSIDKIGPSLLIAFNCRGSKRPLKSTRVLRTPNDAAGRHTWMGYDYASRQVTLTKIGEFAWNEAERVWVPQ